MIQEIFDFFAHLTNPEWIMENGGLYVVVLIVFIETGFPFGFFLPGDSLLFIAGMVIANSLSPFNLSALNLFYWIMLIAIAGIIGNFVGYWIGRKSDRFLFQRKDNWFFKKKYLVQAKEFYDKKGAGAIVLARFLPVVRTFAPIVAGIVKMNPLRFLVFNITGSLLWSVTIVSAGFLLGENVWVQQNLEFIIIGIVAITTAPVLIKVTSSKIKKKTVNMAG